MSKRLGTYIHVHTNIMYTTIMQVSEVSAYTIQSVWYTKYITNGHAVQTVCIHINRKDKGSNRS